MRKNKKGVPAARDEDPEGQVARVADVTSSGGLAHAQTFSLGEPIFEIGTRSACLGGRQSLHLMSLGSE